MCFSASVSYSAAALLVPTGLYAFRQARNLQPPYWMMALAPVFFGIQQGFEGRVWQLVQAQGAGNPVPFVLGFLFFSHFLWLWWIPLSSYLVEQAKLRKRVFLGVALFGFLAGGLVYFTLLFNADWLSVTTRHDSIIYRISSPVRGSFRIGVPPSALYAVVILVPLLFSSHRHIRIFGVLVSLSAALASVVWGYAFVSVWCFFAAAVSLYLVLMIRRLCSIAVSTDRSTARQHP